MRLIQTEYNESFFQDIERQHRVIWPYLKGLKRALANVNFRPETVTMPESLLPEQKEAHPQASPPVETQNAAHWDEQHQNYRKAQAYELNPWPTPHLQVKPGLCLLREIYDAADMGVEITETNKGHNFCLSYNLKVMDSSNCRNQHPHRRILQR